MLEPVGRRFVFGLPDKVVTDFIREMIAENGLFGVILFNRNFETIDNISRLCSDIKAIRDDVVIMIDQEGGEKSRITEGFPNHPSNRNMAENMTAEEVRRLYNESAKALKDIGIDMNLAPVIDLGLDGSYIYERTFSAEAETVIRYAKGAIGGINSAGLFCCAKHFVGIGSSVIDPHENLPTFSGDLKVHIEPFARCAEFGIDAIMTTHIIIPEFSGKPVTVCSEAVSVIRRELGYDGAIFTDDLLMGGATEYNNTEEVAVEALTAGHDVALICHQEEEQIRAFEGFAKAMKKSPLLMKKHEESCQRLRKRFQISI